MAISYPDIRALLLLIIALTSCTDRGELNSAPRYDNATLPEEPGISHIQTTHGDLPKTTGDLAEIVERGVLRVLVASVEEAFLPRAGTPASLDRAMLSELAERRNLKIQFMLVPDHENLIPLLLEGVGDLVAAQLTATQSRKKHVAFTWPLHSVQEIVVGRKDDHELPSSIEDLAGRQIHVRLSSAYAETLAELAENTAPGLEIVPVDERLDAETIVYEVTVGQRPLTVVDSHLLAEIETYNPNIERLFAIREGREIAWAVRPDNPDLKAVIDAFLIEKALTAHTQNLFTGDLDEIKQRGRLRVLTRNNPVTYFLHRGSPMGFDYTLAEMVSKSLGVRMEIIVPPSHDLLIPWLLEGRGDLIAASMTITAERASQVSFSRPYLLVDEILVGSADEPDISSLDELAGRQVHVRRSSSYFDTLTDLAKKVEGIHIVDAPEELETENLIDMVGSRLIPFTVADTHILQIELTYRDDIKPRLVLTGDPGSPPPSADQVGIVGSKEIAFAVRPDNPALRQQLDDFVKRTYRGLEYNLARRRYFQEHRRIAGAGADRPGQDGRLSPYDEIIYRYSHRYGLDWRVAAALAYQESRFNPNAESWMGAQGLFQVMPSTAEMLGFRNLRDPEIGAHAGIMYLHRRISGLDSRIPFDERLWFAMAAYNCGIGHVSDARRLAVKKGWDPDKWFDNVEQAMLLLAMPRYHRQARHGYVRGTEPVNYVASIQNRYSGYVQLLPDYPDYSY